MVKEEQIRCQPGVGRPLGYHQLPPESGGGSWPFAVWPDKGKSAKVEERLSPQPFSYAIQAACTRFY
jgi:hypothetical protein